MILCFFGVHNCHCCILLLCWFTLSYGEVLSLQPTTNQELYTIGHFFRGNDLHAPNRDSDSQQPTLPAPQNEDGVRIGLFSKVHTWLHSLYNWALACLRKRLFFSWWQCVRNKRFWGIWGMTWGADIWRRVFTAKLWPAMWPKVSLAALTGLSSTESKNPTGRPGMGTCRAPWPPKDGARLRRQKLKLSFLGVFSCIWRKQEIAMRCGTYAKWPYMYSNVKDSQKNIPKIKNQKRRYWQGSDRRDSPVTFGQVSPLWKTRLCEFWKARRLLHSVGLTELSGHKTQSL